MQAGKWLSLKGDTENLLNSTNSIFEKNVMDFRFSNSGRYGFLIRERPLEPTHNQTTHFYEIFFSVLDAFRGVLINYKSLTSVFKTYHRFYLLNDNMGVLLDFSRRNAVISQHLIYFDHSKAEVICEFSRNWHFPVDEMLAGTDGTYVAGTSQLLQIDKKNYVPLFGQTDTQITNIVMRIVPADPRNQDVDCLRVSERVFVLNPSSLICSPAVKVISTNSNGESVYTRAEATSFSAEIYHLTGCTTDYPFIYGSRIFFFVSQRMALPLVALPNNVSTFSFSVKWMLEIDIAVFLSLNKPQNVDERIKSLRTNIDLLNFNAESQTELSVNNDFAYVELITSVNDSICLRRICTDESGIDVDNDIIEMYTYIQAGLNIYIRVQYRNAAHNNYCSMRSKWICLNLLTWKWFSFFRQPCRARIPFWFCGIPDGRAFFYRQVWKRGTRQIAFRQLRMLLPPRQVLSLKQLAFCRLGIEYKILKPDTNFDQICNTKINNNSTAKNSERLKQPRLRSNCLDALWNAKFQHNIGGGDCNVKTNNKTYLNDEKSPLLTVSPSEKIGLNKINNNFDIFFTQLQWILCLYDTF